jgi:hypothetical protein
MELWHKGNYATNGRMSPLYCYALYDRNDPCQKLCKGVPDHVIHVHRKIGVLSRKCMNVNLSVHRGSVGGYETPFSVVCHFLPMMVEESALDDLMFRGCSILPARTCWVFGQAYFEKMVLEFYVTFICMRFNLHSVLLSTVLFTLLALTVGCSLCKCLPVSAVSHCCCHFLIRAAFMQPLPPPPPDSEMFAVSSCSCISLLASLQNQPVLWVRGLHGLLPSRSRWLFLSRTDSQLSPGCLM